MFTHLPCLHLRPQQTPLEARVSQSLSKQAKPKHLQTPHPSHSAMLTSRSGKSPEWTLVTSTSFNLLHWTAWIPFGGSIQLPSEDIASKCISAI